MRIVRRSRVIAPVVLVAGLLAGGGGLGAHNGAPGADTARIVREVVAPRLARGDVQRGVRSGSDALPEAEAIDAGPGSGAARPGEQPVAQGAQAPTWQWLAGLMTALIAMVLFIRYPRLGLWALWSVLGTSGGKGGQTGDGRSGGGTHGTW